VASAALAPAPPAVLPPHQAPAASAWLTTAPQHAAPPLPADMRLLEAPFGAEDPLECFLPAKPTLGGLEPLPLLGMDQYWEPRD